MGSAVGSAWKGSDPLEEPGGYSESNSFAEGGYGVGSVALKDLCGALHVAGTGLSFGPVSLALSDDK